MRTLKKTCSKNNNEINLIEWGEICSLEQISPPKTILIIGVIHGEEPQGKFLIEEYIKKSKTTKNRMLFIPCLNPDGMKINKRQNTNGIDLNRNFSTQNWQEISSDSQYFGGKEAGSEIETRFVTQILDEYKPDIILTLHAPFKVVNYDGPAETIAEEISKIIGYPIQEDIGYPTPGSFGTYAGIERNIPVITLELDEEIDTKELLVPVHKIFDYLSNS